MRIIFCLILLAILNSTFAQTPPPDDLFGTDLQDWFWENYYDGKHEELDYDEARFHMYRTIDNENEFVYCVYSGYERSWRSNSNSNNPFPINCEHTIPRSFYNERYPMFSDLHHLFPTYADWNTARSNYRFSEIPDSSTESWMYLDSEQSAIPQSNIDLYSEQSGEFSTGRFEPREDHKGDVARAIFYFYTMYIDEGEITDVVSNLATLCDWHAQDPVSEKERTRNDRIEAIQGDRNPYIDYPEAVLAAWGCEVSTNTEDLTVIDQDFQVTPNPATNVIRLETALSEAFLVRIFDMQGKLVLYRKAVYAGDILDIESLASGIYTMQIETKDTIGRQQFIKK